MYSSWFIEPESAEPGQTFHIYSGDLEEVFHDIPVAISNMLCFVCPAQHKESVHMRLHASEKRAKIG